MGIERELRSGGPEKVKMENEENFKCLFEARSPFAATSTLFSSLLFCCKLQFYLIIEMYFRRHLIRND